MPFTKAQLRNITQSRGQAYIARDRGNYAFRVSEAYIRRKLYGLEDRTVSKEFALYQQAQRDIRAYALTASDMVNAAWRKAVLGYSERRLTRLVYELSQQAYRVGVTAFYAGYIGRLWVLDGMTNDTAPLVIDRVMYRPQIDTVEVYQAYETAALQMIIKQRTIAAAAVGQQVPIGQAARMVSDLGASRNTPARMFAQTMSVTRSLVMRQSNQGAYYAYVAQTGQLKEAETEAADWIVGMMWLSSRDNRVCPVCAKLDGTIWLLSDMLGLALTGLPPDSTHYGCRCTFVLVLVPNVLKGETEPPEDTFEEWITEHGYASLMGDFVDMPLESSQV